MRSTAILNPPQNGGRGTSVPSNSHSISSYFLSRSSLDSSVRLWSDAQAPILLFLGLDEWYSSTCDLSISRAVPSILTCLSISGHQMVADTVGVCWISMDLSLSRFVKNPTSSPSRNFSRTTLFLGAPDSSTVARLIAFGSMTPFSLAS